MTEVRLIRTYSVTLFHAFIEPPKESYQVRRSLKKGKRKYKLTIDIKENLLVVSASPPNK